jgi:hypothetical protein
VATTNGNRKDHMEKGAMYVVRYLHTNGNNRKVERTMRACFLGYKRDEYRNEAVFSLRPLAGTTEIPRDAIQGCYATANHEPVLPKKPQRPFADVVGVHNQRG